MDTTIKGLEFIPEGRGCVKIVFPKAKIKTNGSYVLRFCGEEVVQLYDKVASYSASQVIKEPVAYTEEISTYISEVERSLSVTGKKGDLNLSLICYTDKEDDNWIKLTQRRVCYLASLIGGYLEK